SPAGERPFRSMSFALSAPRRATARGCLLFTPERTKHAWTRQWQTGPGPPPRAFQPALAAHRTRLARRLRWPCSASHLKRRPSIQQRSRPTWVLSRRPDFVPSVAAFITRRHFPVVRIHVGGDFSSAAYGRRWLAIIRQLPRALLLLPPQRASALD